MNKKKYSSIWRVYVSELYRLFHKRSFWLAFMVLFLYAAADYLHTASWIIRGFVKEPYAASGYFMGAYQSFNKYQPIFIKVFPLLMALPCVSAWYEETKRSRNAALVMQRTSPFRYLSAKAMAYFTGNAVMVFVCYALNLLACELTYGEAYPTPFGERYTELYYMALADNHPMPLMGYYVAHTVLYLFVFCIVTAVFAGVLGLFAYACSLWLTRSFALVFVLLYGCFYFTMRYSQYIKGFDLSYVLCVGDRWNTGYTQIFLLINIGLVLLSGILIAVRRIRGLEMYF